MLYGYIAGGHIMVPIGHFMVPVTRTGSANWSPAGEKRQDNDALYAADQSAIERFERNFEDLWNRSDNIVVQ